MNYLLLMAKHDWKQVLWGNVLNRMNTLYGKENLTRLISESKIGPGTATRIKSQATSVGVDVLEKVAGALKVEPWQLLHPTLGSGVEATPLPKAVIVQQSVSGVAPPECANLLRMFSDLPDDPYMRQDAINEMITIIKKYRRPPDQKNGTSRITG